MHGRELLIGLLVVPFAIVLAAVPLAHALDLHVPTTVLGALAGWAAVGILWRGARGRLSRGGATRDSGV